MNHRFFVGSAPLSGSPIVITDKGIIHQIKSVLRAKPGDAFNLFNGQEEVTGQLEAISGAEMVLGSVQPVRRETESHLELTVALALIKGEKLEWAVQKMTEVGIKNIQLLITDRSIVRSLSTNKLERLREIAKEATEQSGRLVIPSILEPVTTEEALRSSDNNYFFTLESDHTVSYASVTSQEQISIFVGPEGGWSDRELELGRELATPVSFGPRTLRAETAAVVIASHFLYK